MNKRKIAIVSTHPIQYYAPLFMLLAKEPTIAIKIDTISMTIKEVIGVIFNGMHVCTLK